MAPPKASKPPALSTQNVQVPRKIISTRSQHLNILGPAKPNNVIARNKRKADGSPGKENSAKRSAFGDITNKDKDDVKNIVKKVIVKTKNLPTVNTVVKLNVINENQPPPIKGVHKILTRASLRCATVVETTAVKPKDVKAETNGKPATRRISNEFEKTEASLYVSACKDFPNDSAKSFVEKEKDIIKSAKKALRPVVGLIPKPVPIPAGVHDFDKENWLDTYQVSEYAMDIFTYLKTREHLFVISDYMDRQVCLSRWMRSLLVDWMVEVQESFELNHETLYLAVKLVDLYLTKMTVGKETLQLLGAAALFVSSKFDERIPPLVDDFLYICDGAYSQRELIRMEINVLKVVNYDLGIPLSYRFLRRYARCAKVSMPTLTLARFILEFSLMDYATIVVSDSKLAAASLFLALKMKGQVGWSTTLEYYSGYKLEEIKNVVHLLNGGLQRKPKEALNTVRMKYSHKIFFEVAKVQTLSNEQLNL